MAKAPIAPPVAEPAPLEPTVTLRGVCREGIGWSLYALKIPVSWLADAERIREGDSLASVLVHQRHACILEAES
jgi:hypothetical protein